MRFVRAIRLAALAIGLALGAGVSGCSDCSLSVETNTLPDGTVDERYFAVLNSDCGGDFWFLETGQLPPGIGLQDNGDVEGIPSQPGAFSFVVGVIDYPSNDVAFKGLSITVEREPE
jgi:hypothetical protein